MPDVFYSDKTFLMSYETSFFSHLTMSSKLMIFNTIKSSMKFSLRLALSSTVREGPTVQAYQDAQELASFVQGSMQTCTSWVE